MGELRVLDREMGDIKLIWDEDNPEEVAAAKEMFDKMRKKGHMAWAVVEKGKKGDNEVKTFDPTLEKIIITPPVKKG